jgi:DmsE family decaheme c-type cytochrome
MNRRSFYLMNAASSVAFALSISITGVQTAAIDTRASTATAALAAAPSSGQSEAQPQRAGSASRYVRKPVDWVALNPEFRGATYVNDTATCFKCHLPTTSYDHTVHAAALRYGAGAAAAAECETCHGPRSGHVEKPTDFLGHGLLEPKEQSAVCLQCHDGGSRMGWKAGPHNAAEVSCSACHMVMEKKSDRALLSVASTTELCYRCHLDVRGEMLKTSHHPVREGRLDCASCHNVHGATEGLLVKNTLNETCFTCHTEKRGPFLWEHAPVREGCDTCHMPHGSNQRFLLTNRDPFMCLTCHSYGGHINLPRYNRTSNPYGNGCTNCHITTHGSNHPSGAKQTR